MEFATIIKNNRVLYKIYYYIISAALNFVRFFVKTDDKLILFVSYGGRHFNDSPRCLYKAMLADERFADYKLVWAFIKPKQFDIATPKIRIDSFHYFIVALKARCWITNVAIERGLNFRGKNTFYFHTTHTTLPKKMGYDDTSGSFSFPCGYKYDCSCAQSETEKQMQQSMFHIKPERIFVSGYPKNDILTHYSEQTRHAIRKKLNIDDNRKVILYAPTYRDISFGAMRCPIDFKKWEDILGHDYVILFRAHPVVANETEIDSSTGFVFDVSNYPDNMELMIASDILISDYSGIFFEYGVQDKPMFCFAYDYDQYIKVRELYFDIRQLIPGGYLSEEELLDYIKQSKFEDIRDKIEFFRTKYLSEYGNATRKCIDIIIENIAYKSIS